MPDIDIDKRSGKDRRTKSGFNIRSLLFGGNREKIRRQEDAKGIFYVDQYSSGLFFIIVLHLIAVAYMAVIGWELYLVSIVRS